MDVHVGCEVRSCCDWQAGEEEKEMPLPPSYLTAQDRITDSGGRGEGKGGERRKKMTKKPKRIYAAAAMAHQEFSDLGDILDLFSQKHKSTLILW